MRRYLISENVDNSGWPLRALKIGSLISLRLQTLGKPYKGIFLKQCM